MSILSDSIEQFIKSLMSEEDKRVELQRNELAQYFGCAPSQINYVIKTRFNLDKGYYTESQRGGGGYIRIIRVEASPDDYLMNLANERIGNCISERDALSIIEHMYELKIVTRREVQIIASAIRSNVLMAPVQLKDVIRAGILKSMVVALITYNENGV